MKFDHIIKQVTDDISNENSGYKKFPKANYIYTKERAKEFLAYGWETLLDDPYFLNLKWNGKQGLWPENKDILLQLEEENKKRLINQFIYHASIGVGKSTIAAALTWLQTFEVITIPNHLEYFGLTEGSTIAIIALSRDAEKAKKVTFQKNLPIFVKSGFFSDYFPPQVPPHILEGNSRQFPSELRFPKNIVIFPGTSDSSSVLGHNTFSGVIDEANDLQVTVDSKKSVMKKVYDAAQETTDEVLSRMYSRFPWDYLHREGKKHGILSMIGQARHPNSFLAKKIKEARALGSESTIFWVEKSMWEVQPKERFSKETFYFDKTNRKIIEKLDKFPEDTKCWICGIKLKKEGFMGNKNSIVCSMECYKESYNQQVETDKDKSAEII